MNREIATGAASIYPLTGDVSSSAGSPTVTVIGLQNIPIQAGFIVDDDFLVYDNTLNMWVPRLIVPGDLPLATATTPGIVQPDDVTITVSGGVISAIPAAGGINQLTGDVTAGPGSGSQVATLANTAVTPGSYTNTNLTVDSKGRITLAASGAASPSAVQEVPTGTLNGVNKIFTLSFTPSPAASLVVYLNGVEQLPGGIHITVSGATIIFTTAPISTDLLRATYTH